MFRKLFSAISLLIVVLAGINTSWATCSSNVSYEVRTTNFRTITVPHDAQSGAVLATAMTGPWESGADLWGCTTNWTYNWSMTLFMTRSEIDGVYKTNIPGVGIRVTDVTQNKTLTYIQQMAANQYAKLANDGMRTELVKINGDVTGGNLTLGKYAVASITGFGNMAELDLASGSITVTACSLTTSGLSFPLGNVPLTSFSNAVGFIPQSSQNTQSLGLNCSSGVNVGVTLQGDQHPDVSTTSVMALTGQGAAGVAKGVGVQIVYNGTPLDLNTPVVLKQSSGGQETFPFTARYYQTSASVTEGTSNATATLSITYQ